MSTPDPTPDRTYDSALTPAEALEAAPPPAHDPGTDGLDPDAQGGEHEDAEVTW